MPSSSARVFLEPRAQEFVALVALSSVQVDNVDCCRWSAPESAHRPSHDAGSEQAILLVTCVASRRSTLTPACRGLAGVAALPYIRTPGPHLRDVDAVGLSCFLLPARRLHFARASTSNGDGARLAVIRIRRGRPGTNEGGLIKLLTRPRASLRFAQARTASRLQEKPRAMTGWIASTRRARWGIPIRATGKEQLGRGSGSARAEFLPWPGEQGKKRILHRPRRACLRIGSVGLLLRGAGL
jgi:hypothetical protein